MKIAHRELKMVSAGIGVGALVAMAGVVVSLSNAPAEAQNRVEPPGITTGQTITETTPPTTPETSVATPPVSVTTPSGFAVPH